MFIYLVVNTIVLSPVSCLPLSFPSPSIFVRSPLNFIIFVCGVPYFLFCPFTFCFRPLFCLLDLLFYSSSISDCVVHVAIDMFLSFR